jgi:hypothetical protein
VNARTRNRRIRTRITSLVLALAVIVLLAWARGLIDPSAIGQADGQGPAGLTIAAESHQDSYERDAFGSRWKDIDRNGCGQRNDVLARDLTGVRRQGDCVVLSGTLTDPYTGQRVSFSKSRATEVQVDHIVPLADAWRSGAWAWTDERRERFANDLTELQASSAESNRDKSDHDAATWAPDGAARACTWAQQVVEIKARWELSVDRAEAEAITELLDGCSA